MTTGLIEQLLARIMELEHWRKTLVLPEMPFVVTTTGLEILRCSWAAMGVASQTNERGFLVQLTNGTGSASVKGSLVSCSTTADDAFILQTNEYDTIGVVAESGIANGELTWVWVNGSICRVLYKDAVAATHGNILIAADTNGRAIDIANPGGGLPGTDTHFKECGHVLETASAGTDVLVLVSLHFN